MDSRKITVKRAAALLGKHELFVRECIKDGSLPIGTAMQNPGSGRWNFLISPTALAEYIGCSVAELYGDSECGGDFDAGDCHVAGAPRNDNVFSASLSREQAERVWRAFLRALSEEGMKIV